MNIRWETSHDLWRNGKYKESVDLRSELLTEIYKYNGVLDEKYFPPVYSLGFSTAIGHLAILGTHIAAQKFNILPQGPRHPVTIKNADNINYLRTYGIDKMRLQYSDSTGWADLPSQWHIAERLEMFKTMDGFRDLYSILDKVFSENKITKDVPIFSLPEDYKLASSESLRKIGVSPDDWFVCLHIRNTGNYPARRNQPVESYVPAIKEILKHGGKIIRVGDSTMGPIIDDPNFLDLTTNDSLRKLHLYALARAAFFIGTTSGPASVPPLFGVPTLVTNATSIGRNVLAVADKSLYLPKRISKDGKPVEFSIILNSFLGYDELDLRALSERGYSLSCNSSTEILNATREMIDLVIYNLNESNNSYESTIASIRAQAHFSSSGKFAQTYIDENFSWLGN